MGFHCGSGVLLASRHAVGEKSKVRERVYPPFRLRPVTIDGLHNAWCAKADRLHTCGGSENVLAGHLTWADYRPSDRPNTVRVLHHKTGEPVSLPLSDRDGPLFPELTAYLDRLQRLDVPIVLMKPKRGDKNRAKPAKPYLLRTARNRVRAAARAAKLPDHLTLAACRHGGLTELGDAELTEQGVMALSGHRIRRRPVSTSNGPRRNAHQRRGSDGRGWRWQGCTSRRARSKLPAGSRGTNDDLPTE
jgi:hypothetical protein